MRRLKTSDIFAFCRICTEAHVRDEVKAIAEVIQRDGANADATQVGYDLILSIIERLGTAKAEQMVYEFLGSIWEMDAQAVANMDLTTFSDTMRTWGSEYLDRDTLRGFFGSLSRLMR